MEGDIDGGLQGGTTGEITAAIDRTGPYAEYVIADIDRDGAWVAIRESEALSLDAWK